MFLKTEMYPAHGFNQKQSYYNDNDYYSSEDNYNSNYGSSMQLKKPYGYPSVTTPPRTQHHMTMSHSGGYSSHDDDSLYNKDKYQSAYGPNNSHSQYGHMAQDSANFSSNSTNTFPTDGAYGSGMQHSSYANGGYGSGMQHSPHANGGYGSGMQPSSYANGGYGSGMQHSSYANGGYGSGIQHSSGHSHMSRGLEHDSSKYYAQDIDRRPGYYEQHNKNTDMWNSKSL